MVRNCHARDCPKNRDELERTERERVGHCKVCQKNVYYCDRVNEVERLTKEGKRIAYLKLLPRLPIHRIEYDVDISSRMGATSPTPEAVDGVDLAAPSADDAKRNSRPRRKTESGR